MLALERSHFSGNYCTQYFTGTATRETQHSRIPPRASNCKPNHIEKRFLRIHGRWKVEPEFKRRQCETCFTSMRLANHAFPREFSPMASQDYPIRMSLALSSYRTTAPPLKRYGSQSLTHWRTSCSRPPSNSLRITMLKEQDQDAVKFCPLSQM